MAHSRTERIFQVKEALLPRTGGGYLQRWYVYRNCRPIDPINRYLNRKSLKSPGTGKTYAYTLASWLELLFLRGTRYDEATRLDVDAFVDHLVYGMHSNSDILSIEQKVTYATLYGAITCIQNFYRWFDGAVDVFIPTVSKKQKKAQKRTVRHSFLYGQIYEVDVEEIIDIERRRLKPSGFKKHWLTEEEKTAILAKFNKARDKAIFMLLCEGMRIDEALSIKYSSYDQLEMTVKPSRSKGYSDEYEDKFRIVAFSDHRTAEYLDQYITTERTDVETELDDYLTTMFINLQKNPSHYGKPVKYRNWWEILKTATRNAGIDPAEIATHVGRRSKVQKLLEDGTDAEHIRQIMGWASLSPLDNYRDLNSKKIIKGAAEKARRKKVKLSQENKTNKGE